MSFSLPIAGPGDAPWSGECTRGRRVVLLVEDNPEDFEAAVRAFRVAQASCTLVRCEDGDEALDYLLHRSALVEEGGEPVPVLVLLDLNLPGTDGREVLAEIKQSREARHVPVVILSTSRDAGDVEFCYRAGANAYLQKSVDLGRFTRAIGTLASFWLDAAVLSTERECR